MFEDIIDKFFEAIGNTGGDLADALGDFFYTEDADGNSSLNVGEILPLILGVANATGAFDRDQDPVGWQGTIAPKQAVRERVETNYDPERRPGAYGQRYFSDTTFVDPTKPNEVAEAEAAAAAEASQLYDDNVARKDEIAPLLEAMKNPHQNFENKPDPEETEQEGLAAGGPVRHKGVMGLYMGGPTDGMADQIPASIAGVQPAALSDGEFVVPADAVSHLGNGNSNAGAEQLMRMIEGVRQARTGTPKQGKQIDPNTFMPGGTLMSGTGDPTDGAVVNTDPTNPDTLEGQDSTLASYIGPYVSEMLSRGWGLADLPYEAYEGPLTAGSTGLQDQAFEGIAGIDAGDFGFGDAANAAGDAGDAAAGLEYDPYDFTNTYDPTQFSSGYEATEFNGDYTASGDFNTDYTATDYVGETGRWTDDGVAESYMNPFMEQVLNPQMDEIRRNAEITRLNDASRSTQAGAFGGSRQAIMESEGWDNMARIMNETTGAAYRDAYNTGADIFNQDENRLLDALGRTDSSNQFAATLSQQDQAAAEAANQFEAEFGLKADELTDSSKRYESDSNLRADELTDSSNRYDSEMDMRADENTVKDKQFGADYALDAIQTQLEAALAEGNLSQDEFNATMDIFNKQLEAGGIERDILQEGIDADKAQFDEEQAYEFKMVQFMQSLLDGLPLGATQNEYTEDDFLTMFGEGSGGFLALFQEMFPGLFGGDEGGDAEGGTTPDTAE